MKVYLKQTQEYNSYKAGVELGLSIQDCTPCALILSVSSGYDVSELVRGLYEMCGSQDFVLAGGSGDGFFSGSQYVSNGAAMLVFEGDLCCSVSMVKGIKSDPEKAVKRAVAKIADRSKATCAFVFADFLSADGVKLAAGFEKEMSGVPLLGAFTGDDRSYEKGEVICNRKVESNALVVLTLCGPSVVMNRSCGWIPAGPLGTVSSARCRCLRKIDGMDAVQFISSQTGGIPREAEIGLFPLACYKNEDEFFLLSPLNVDKGALKLSGSIDKSMPVRIAYVTGEDIMASAEEMIKPLRFLEIKVAAAVLFMSAGNRWIAGRKIEQLLDSIAGIVGRDVPLFGCTSFGEIGRNMKFDFSGGELYFSNHSQMLMLIGEMA